MSHSSRSSSVNNSSSGSGYVTKREWEHKYADLSGNMNMIKTQVAEVHKRLLRVSQIELDVNLEATTRELNRVKAEVHAIRAELGQTAKQSSMHQVQADVVRIKAEVGQTAGHSSLQQLYRDVEKVKSDLGQTASHSSLQQLYRDVEKVKSDLGQTASHGSIQQIYADVAEMKAELGESAKHESIEQLYANVHQMQRTLTSLQKSVKDVDATRNQMTSVLGEMRQETNKAKQLSQELNNFKRQMDQKAIQMKNSVDAELRRAGQESKAASQKVSKQERELIEMRQLLRLPAEFGKLTQTLNDLGVLKPPKVERTPEEPIAVGTIGLATDCFSSRLLVKVGYLKARAERHKAKHLEMSDAMDARTLGLYKDFDSENGGSTDEEEDAAILRGCDMVHGIAAPAIEEGGEGYTTVTTGMIAIVIVTIMFQLMIICVLVYYGLSPSECYEKPPTTQEWIILHGSKAAAITVAGMLMGKDFMDIVNHSMVTFLIEPKFDIEMAIISFLRFSLTVLIGLANLVMFEGMVSPFSVWINMAALAFVGELGSAVNDQMIKGVFGHCIRSTVTSLNYELTFVSEYPWFIKYVQWATILFVVVFITVSALVVLLRSDPMCPI